MELVILATSPIPSRLLIGLGILIIGVLIAFWFFMAKNNPRSQKVDEMPENNDAQTLQDQYDRGEITEEDYKRRLKDTKNDTHSR